MYPYDIWTIHLSINIMIIATVYSATLSVIDKSVDISYN